MTDIVTRLKEMREAATQAIEWQDASDSGAAGPNADYLYNRSVGAHMRHEEASSPANVLAVLDEIERLRGLCKRAAETLAENCAHYSHCSTHGECPFPCDCEIDALLTELREAAK